MFLVTLLFFREPTRSGERKVASVAHALKNMVVVLANFRFVLFLLIFSSFWIVFWQQFVSAPLFLRGYVNPNANVDLVLSVDALAVICFQILISYVTRKIPTFPAMTLGLVISSLAWLILIFVPTTLGLIAALIVLAIGEMTQSARYYEYISRLAPPGQQGVYMGYAFLPIAIGYFVAGPLGGYLLHEFGDVLHRPRQMWWVITAIGLTGAVLMVIYDKVFKPGDGSEAGAV
jgi:MFS family permease